MKHLLIFFLICLSDVYSQSFYFKSGFDSSVYINQYELNGVTNTKYADLYGTDNFTGYNWVTDLDDSNHPNIGNFRIYYETGDTIAAKASIVDDPLNNTNKVLKFALNAPNVPNNGDPKGRIQAALNNNIALHEFSFRVKLYIHPDIDTLKYYNQEFSWFTLMEFWNNSPFDDFPYRITLNIQKPDTTTGSNLYFGAHGQTRNPIDSSWDDVWDEIDYSFVVPTGEWLTFETYFLEGNALNGRYKVTVSDSLENTHTLFDITDFTHHPQDAMPDGVSSFNPMKIYTSGGLIQGMQSANAELSVFWDDFELWIDETTNTEPLGAAKKMLYPNPTNAYINIENSNSIRITDKHGRQVLERRNLSNNESIDLSHLSADIYFVDLDGYYTKLIVK